MQRSERGGEVHLDHGGCDQDLKHRCTKRESSRADEHAWLISSGRGDRHSQQMCEEKKSDDSMRDLNCERRASTLD